MKEKEWLSALNGQTGMTKVMNSNQYTKEFGLSLTKEDVVLLMEERKECLKKEERIEFGESILNKLIFAFCNSPYIYQDNYVDTLGRLQEIFYLYKNESMDEASDDELVEYMKQQFDGVCQGSLDYLEDTSLERFARQLRSRSRRFIGTYEDGLAEEEEAK